MRETMKRFIYDEKAQVATLFELIIVVVAVGIAYMALGYVVDSYVSTMNDIGLIVSQTRLDALAMMLNVFRLFIVVAGIALIVYLIKVGADRRARQVV